MNILTTNIIASVGSTKMLKCSDKGLADVYRNAWRVEFVQDMENGKPVSTHGIRITMFNNAFARNRTLRARTANGLVNALIPAVADENGRNSASCGCTDDYKTFTVSFPVKENDPAVFAFLSVAYSNRKLTASKFIDVVENFRLKFIR